MNRSALALLVVSAFALGACGAPSEGESSSDLSSGVPVSGEAPMFPGFSYDTGLLPKVSPAQVSFKASAGGALRVSARGHVAGGKLEGNKGSGKLAIDLHAKLEGHLKVTSTFKSYDGDIPGLKDLDIAATGEVPFDPFLLGDGEEVEAVANMPETKLPDVPLSGVPGHLELTIKQGTTISAKLHGSCLRGAESKATFTGATTTSGTLVLGATLKLDLPKPLDKAIDLPDISVALPEMHGTIDAASDAAGIADFTAGSCSDAPASDPTAAPPPASQPDAPGACNDLANTGSFVTIEAMDASEPVPQGGTLAEGTYALLAVRTYPGAPGMIGDPETAKRTIRFAGGKFDVVTEGSGQTTRASGSYTARNGTFLRSFACPAGTPDSTASYTATPTSLTLIFDDHTVYTYGKQ